MATVTARDRSRYAGDYAYEAPPRKGTGWIAYAAIMLGLAGAWNIFDGILAIANSKVYTLDSTFVFSDLRTWGWIVMFLGIAQVVAALALASGSQVARWFGIACAGVNAFGQLMFLPAYPLWALSMFALDLLVIYGLSVYGGKELELD